MKTQLFDNNTQDEVVSEINMIPMIDIMLVLLIVFIITAPVMHHAVNLQLPQVSNEQQILQPEAIQIAIQADGTYHWNAEVISEEQLQIKLTESSTLSPQPTLHLSADKEVRYERVINLLQQAQKASLSNISFVTLPKD